MNISQIITSLKLELQNLNIENFSQIILMKEKIDNLNQQALNFDGDNWKGNWAQENYDVYLDPETKELTRLSEEQIGKYIEGKVNSNFEDIQKQANTIKKIFENFKIKVVTELSIIKSKAEDFHSEIELLDKIENYEWGMNTWDYLEMRRPKRIITSNPEVLLSKGMSNPPHLNVLANLISTFSILDAILNFEKIVSRVLRQLEIKLSTEEEIPNSDDFLNKLIESFHSVSRQLQNRYNKRETLHIQDEYDVQDLLHALLKIKFDDIRAEEYTPSYAGSSSRVDFLLKKEKIVIEVKKTRKGLTDREVGNQLILDTQHYKAHPDCKKLICFVYDPENRIQNPRGLEQDLNNITSEDFKVEVYIRP